MKAFKQKTAKWAATKNCQLNNELSALMPAEVQPQTLDVDEFDGVKTKRNFRYAHATVSKVSFEKYIRLRSILEMVRMILYIRSTG